MQRREVLDYMELIVDEKEQSDANLIAFNNGVYDLVTGELKPFSTDIVITNKIPWDYKPDAYSELADSTLNKLACGDAAIRALLEECIGYCFYRRNELGKAFILTGDKSNGILAFINDTGVDMIENEPTNEVYKRYQVFCADNSMQPMSNIVFSKQINKRLDLEISVVKLNGQTRRIFRSRKDGD